MKPDETTVEGRSQEKSEECVVKVVNFGFWRVHYGLLSVHYARRETFFADWIFETNQIQNSRYGPDDQILMEDSIAKTKKPTIQTHLEPHRYHTTDHHQHL